jgi:hypothetical protein
LAGLKLSGLTFYNKKDEFMIAEVTPGVIEKALLILNKCSNHKGLYGKSLNVLIMKELGLGIQKNFAFDCHFEIKGVELVRAQ